MAESLGTYYKWLVPCGSILHEPFLAISSGDCNTLSTKFVDVAQAEDFRNNCSIKMAPECHKKNWILVRITTERV